MQARLKARLFFMVGLQVLEFVVSGFRAGVRGRSFQAVFLLGLVLIGVAYLSGSFSPRQPQTVALDIGLSGLRFSLVLLNLFWIQELVAREVDRKTILFSLAYPVSRASFLLGRLLAVVGLSTLAAIILALLLLATVLATGGDYSQETPVRLGMPYVATICGLILDATVVASFALCVSTVSTVAILPLVLGAAFAVGGKALGATTGYLAAGADGDANMVARFGRILDLAQWLLPDLSRLDWRDWPLYGLFSGFDATFWSVLMAVAYIAMLSSLAVWFFSRREFS